MLSDELLEIGRSANPKSNMDMAKKAKTMFDLANVHHLNNVQYGIRKVENVFNLVCKQLNKEGYSFYKPELFIYDIKTSKSSIASSKPYVLS